MDEPTSQLLDEFEARLMQRLRSVYGDKPWILAGGVAQGLDAGVRSVGELGASKAIGIASQVGVGEIGEDVRFIISDDSQVPADAPMVVRMHDNNREMHNLPPWVVAEVDEWDPQRSAQVIVDFTINAGLVAGRPTFGARRPEWAALEDKITIREVWNRAGITTAPDRVVDTGDLAAMVAAHDELETEAGTVWAVDNDQGWHGGGHGTHWVTTAAAVEELAERISVDHRQVRVQPFLEGVPCSIHGMVLADSTIAFRPCEMLVLLNEETKKFVYSRAATFWDPAAKHRDSMRKAARAIGDELRTMVDFRGVFTLDGVLTADGFGPTEINPRFGAALPPRLPMADGGELPVFLTHVAAVAGQLDDLDPALLEALFLDRLDRHRFGTAFIRTSAGPEGDEQNVAIGGRWANNRFVDLEALTEDVEGEANSFATATWGETPAGGLVFTRFTDRFPTGSTVAPTLVEIRSFLDEYWSLNLDQLTPAFKSS